MFNQGRKSVGHSREENDFLNNHDQQKARTADISSNTSQTFANDNDTYLVEQVKNHCHWNRKLEFLIKWLGYSNCQNTLEPKDHLSPALVQEYFQQSSLKKPISTNKVFMTKTLMKGPPITWRCQTPCTLVLLCLFVSWFSLTTAHLFMIVANHSNLGYLDSPHWRIVLTVCYIKKPLLQHSTGK